MTKKSKQAYEKPYRSIVKAFSWRITATLVTMAASLLISGDVTIAISIGGIDFISKLLIYYFHERLWSKLKFGLIEDKDLDYHI